tara:strand:+ start:242 stop:451 length:210 start_codon:yes stop_codon:yes gene_type:complete
VKKTRATGSEKTTENTTEKTTTHGYQCKKSARKTVSKTGTYKKSALNVKKSVDNRKRVRHYWGMVNNGC